MGLSMCMSYVHGTYGKMEAYCPKLCKRCCERVKGNQISNQNRYLCLEAADRFRMNNYTTSNHPPSAFLTPTQEKIALLELEMCYLQVRSCLSQVRIIRISQQTSSLTVSVFVLVSIQVNFNVRTFLMTFLLKTNF